MVWIKQLKVVGVLMVLAGIVTACSISYKFNGSSIDYTKVKTISFENFPNRSAGFVWGPMESMFNTALQDIYMQQTRLKQAKRGGDLQLSGEITNYDALNKGIGSDGYSSMVELRMTVRVNFVNNSNPTENMNGQQFSASREYNANQQLSAVQDELVTQMIKEIVEQTGSEPFSVMTQQQLYEWITHPELLNRDTLYELRTLLARYPYFQTVRLLYLKNLFLLHDITFGEELRKAALYVADRKVLFYLIEGERFIISPLDKQEKLKEEGGLDRTLSLIDAFLSSLPEDSAAVELPMDVTADYTSFLLHEEEHPSDDGIPRMKGQSLIDDFIEKSAEEPLLPQLGIKEEVPVKKEMPEEDEPEAEEDIEDESYFTETLAKIYVKQQRYSKALEIIKKLNLKYPKKNAYFADQIRFLEKLIINTKSK